MAVLAVVSAAVSAAGDVDCRCYSSTAESSVGRVAMLSSSSSWTSKAEEEKKKNFSR